MRNCTVHNNRKSTQRRVKDYITYIDYINTTSALTSQNNCSQILWDGIEGIGINGTSEQSLIKDNEERDPKGRYIWTDTLLQSTEHNVDTLDPELKEMNIKNTHIYNIIYSHVHSQNYFIIFSVCIQCNWQDLQNQALPVIIIQFAFDSTVQHCLCFISLSSLGWALVDIMTS